MVNGFEDETAPLTTEEISMSHLIAKGFQTKIGSASAVTSDHIIFHMKARGHKISPPRFRKIIHHIRVTKMVKNLVATSTGYYIENDPEKLRDYIKSLKQRAGAIMAVANSY